MLVVLDLNDNVFVIFDVLVVLDFNDNVHVIFDVLVVLDFNDNVLDVFDVHVILVFESCPQKSAMIPYYNVTRITECRFTRSYNRMSTYSIV